MTHSSSSETSPIEWLWQAERMRQLRRLNHSISKERRSAIDEARVALSAAQSLANSSPHNRSEVVPSTVVVLHFVALYRACLAEANRRNALDGIISTDIIELMRQAGVTVEEYFSSEQSGGAVRELIERLNRSVFAGDMSRDQATEALFFEFVEAMVDRAEASLRGVERIWFLRLLRVGVPLLVLGGVIMFVQVTQTRQLLEDETMIPWRASSTDGFPACQSPRQGCEQDHFFFHTRHEKRPWIEFDLAGRPSVSGVTITNRTDCHGCSARAVPLVVELGDENREFHEVARRDRDFVTWDVKFPTQAARYLRLRVDRPSQLHLRQVRIHR